MKISRKAKNNLSRTNALAYLSRASATKKKNQFYKIGFRQILFLKLSGIIQRKIGLKALELGGNAVLGSVLIVL